MDSKNYIQTHAIQEIKIPFLGRRKFILESEQVCSGY